MNSNRLRINKSSKIGKKIFFQGGMRPIKIRRYLEVEVLQFHTD